MVPSGDLSVWKRVKGRKGLFRRGEQSYLLKKRIRGHLYPLITEGDGLHWN